MQIVYHVEDGVWWADSPDVAGFYAGDETLRDLRRRVREALAYFLERDEAALEPDLVERLEDGGLVRDVRIPASAGSWTSQLMVGGPQWDPAPPTQTSIGVRPTLHTSSRLRRIDKRDRVGA